jgi:exosortase/archaeosortase family protein
MTLASVRQLGPRVAAARGLPLRAAALVGLVLLAYNYSLITLARGLTLQTPLAYLALVPLIALILGIARLRLEARGLPIHDRQVDWIVGATLLVVSGAILALVPGATSATFWLQRVDLLTLPIFVAGLVTLLFGIRRTWSLKGPIAFLLLAWPVPYTVFLGGAIGAFTDLTAQIVGALTRVVPIARASASDETLFVVGSGAHAFSVSIGSACAGVNGFVGFLLVGTALLFVVRGPLARRLIWLGAGLALVFALNVLRIAAILAVGAGFGQAAALEVLHPVAGLIVFNIGVLAMIALVPRFGLRFLILPRAGADAHPDPNPVRRVRPALVFAIGVAAVLAVTNATFARYDALSSGLADARLKGFDVDSVRLAGWSSRYIAAFPMAKQYFGSTGTWDRALYKSGDIAPLTSLRPMYVDVLTTDDPSTFAAYTVENCYRFHGYDITSITTADIGAGVSSQVIDYVNRKTGTFWSTLWWEWPYNDGVKTRYERVVFVLGEGPKSQYRGVTAGDVATQDPRFVETDAFLVSVARNVVRAHLETASR